MLTQYYFVFIANTKDSIGFDSFVAANEKQRCKKTWHTICNLDFKAEEH